MQRSRKCDSCCFVNLLLVQECACDIFRGFEKSEFFRCLQNTLLPNCCYHNWQSDNQLSVLSVLKVLEVTLDCMMAVFCLGKIDDLRKNVLHYSRLYNWFVICLATFRSKFILNLRISFDELIVSKNVLGLRNVLPGFKICFSELKTSLPSRNNKAPI